jgi:acetoin utilization deacetylase AcuC-like enzyme
MTYDAGMLILPVTRLASVADAGDIAAARLPTVFVFEGGYAVAEVGVNTVNVLEGFEAA